MKQDALTPPSIRSVRKLLIGLVILLGQLGVAGAGLLHSDAEMKAAPHFESGGTDLHYSHNDADCLTCRAQHLGNAAPLGNERVEPPALKALAIASENSRPDQLGWYAAQHSRAPPTIV